MTMDGYSMCGGHQIKLLHLDKNFALFPRFFALFSKIRSKYAKILQNVGIQGFWNVPCVLWIRFG